MAHLCAYQRAQTNCAQGSAKGDIIYLHVQKELFVGVGGFNEASLAQGAGIRVVQESAYREVRI